MSNHLVKNKSEKEKNPGIKFYRSCGKILVGCSVISIILLIFVSMLPQDYEKYDLSLFFSIWFVVSCIVFIAGFFIIILCKKSSRFQAWVEKDVISFAEQQLCKENCKEHKQKK